MKKAVFLVKKTRFFWNKVIEGKIILLEGGNKTIEGEIISIEY